MRMPSMDASKDVLTGRRYAVTAASAAWSKYLPSVLFVVVTAGLLLSAVKASSAAVKPKHERSECLVRIYIETNDRNHGGNVRNDVFFSFLGYALLRKKKLPDYEVAWDIKKNMYLLYGERCAERYQLSRRLIAAYNKRYPNGASLTLGEDTVRLSADYAYLHFIAGKPKFRRMDCIVHLLIGHTNPLELARAERRALDFFLSYGKNNYPESPLFGFHGDGGNSLYLQYDDRCDRKFETARAMVSAYLARFPDGVTITVGEDAVRPEELGSESFGPQWIDGHPDNAASRKARQGATRHGARQGDHEWRTQQGHGHNGVRSCIATSSRYEARGCGNA